jgi:hypothetical protein
MKAERRAAHPRDLPDDPRFGFVVFEGRSGRSTGASKTLAGDKNRKVLAKIEELMALVQA